MFYGRCHAGDAICLTGVNYCFTDVALRSLNQRPYGYLLLPYGTYHVPYGRCVNSRRNKTPVRRLTVVMDLDVD